MLAIELIALLQMAEPDARVVLCMNRTTAKVVTVGQIDIVPTIGTREGRVEIWCDPD
jgi:hypothetical protein